MNISDIPANPGCHCYVIGGGPSASKHYGSINTADTVIAPSTMLIPLQAAGIFPEYTCIIDPGSVMPLHFKGADRSNSLVYMPGIVKSCYRDWEGPKYMVWDLPGSSVLHLCVDVALRIGASEITLIGCDFNYGTEQKSHADGVVTSYKVTERNSIKVKNGRGEDVLTERSLCEYASQLETMIAKRKDVKWYRVGLDGLPVEGCEYIE